MSLDCNYLKSWKDINKDQDSLQPVMLVMPMKFTQTWMK